MLVFNWLDKVWTCIVRRGFLECEKLRIVGMAGRVRDLRVLMCCRQPAKLRNKAGLISNADGAWCFGGAANASQC